MEWMQLVFQIRRMNNKHQGFKSGNLPYKPETHLFFLVGVGFGIYAFME
jgi:hypothetical protein